MPLGTKVGLGSGHIVLDGAQLPPNFRPMSIVAKRSPISATAKHLLSGLHDVNMQQNALMYRTSF